MGEGGPSRAARGRHPVADAGEGCIAITQIAALFSPASGSPPAEERHDGRRGSSLRSSSPGGGGWRLGEEILGTFTCVHGMSADALDYLRFTLRRFQWIASDAPRRAPCRRMLRANDRTLVAAIHDGTRTFAVRVIGRAYFIF